LHLASRKPAEKAAALLRWSFGAFPGHEICLLYVHRPSTVIPTLLGELPASGANPETLAAYRCHERNEALNLLSSCLTICSRSRVSVRILATEAEEVQKGMVYLLKQHGIRKVVIGSSPEFMIGKRSSCKDCHAARCAPSFCEMFFVNKTKLIWKRRAASLLAQFAELKSELFNVIFQVKASESAHSLEIELRKDAEEALEVTLHEHKKLLEDREKTEQQLQEILLDIAVSDSRLREANRRCEEVSSELKSVRSSIAALRKEKQKLLQQKTETSKFPEFSLTDVEAATCDFSECFVIGKGGNGIVYKGEMLNRTVAVKKLLHYNSQTDFIEVVRILDKLRHPHLVELVGICPEAWSLVYEYLPGPSLHSYVSSSSKLATLGWKSRVRIIADIASGLLFLHSFRPRICAHGNLKPRNLLLDSNGRCKISDYADRMLSPSFGGADSTGASVYADPESQNSDIYSFGMIILQLVTGKHTQKGFLSEVLPDSSAGEWPVYVARRLVELGLRFCNRSSRNSLDLTPSLVKELKSMLALADQTVPSFFCCPIRHELMYEPQVAADGFTYEGEAIRGWLESGHETSPMTNLKLNHLNLIPNHDLRLAIQDWI
ncbi:hypothetical protein M569_13590, partial [Genlisea aurea]